MIAQLRRTLFFYIFFLNPCIMSLVVPNITHFDDMIQVTGSFTGVEQRLIQHLLQLPGDRHCQHSTNSNSCEREQSTRTGSAGKVSHWAYILKRKEGREHFCHLFFSSFNNLHFPTGKHPFLHASSWDWREIPHADRAQHFRFVNLTLHGLSSPTTHFL